MIPNKKRTTRLAIIAVILMVFTAGGVLWFSGNGTALAATNAFLDGSVKTASPDAVSPGSDVIYSIVLTNSDQLLPTGQVIVGDLLPDDINSIANPNVDPPGTAL